MRKAIHDAVREVIVMIDESIALAFLVTAGVGTLAGVVLTANVVRKIEETGAGIRTFITAEKFEEQAAEVEKAGNTLENTATKLNKVEQLEAKTIEAEASAEANAAKETSTAAEQQWNDLFANGRTPKASELEDYAKSQGWTKIQTENGPPKYRDENGVVRLTIKQGSDRAVGSENPHVEIRNAEGQGIDPFGNQVTRKSPGNHTDIVWDW